MACWKSCIGCYLSGVDSKMTKSEEWDIKEKELDEKSSLFRKFTSDKEFRNKFRECMVIYDAHKKSTCQHVCLLIGQNRETRECSIKILRCGSCGWSYKKWWKFW